MKLMIHDIETNIMQRFSARYQRNTFGQTIK